MQGVDQRITGAGQRAVLTGDRGAQGQDAALKGQGPALHEPVGVQREHSSRRQLDPDLAEPAGAQADRHARRQLRDVGPAVRQRQDRGQVTGQGHGAGPLAGINYRVDAGRTRTAGQRRGPAIQPAHHLGGLQVQVGQGVRGGPQLRQQHGGRRPVSHYVSDHEARPVPGQRDDVPPVPADDLAGRRGGAPGHLHEFG